MTVYQDIQELRAELGRCNDGRERDRIETELKAAQAEQAKLDEAFEAWLEDPD